MCLDVLKFKIKKPVSSLQTQSNNADNFPEVNYKVTAISFLKTKDLMIPLVFCTKGPSLWANFDRHGCSLCPGGEGFLQELTYCHAQSQSAGITLKGAARSVSQECVTLQKRLCCGFPGSWERRDRPSASCPDPRQRGAEPGRRAPLRNTHRHGSSSEGWTELIHRSPSGFHRRSSSFQPGLYRCKPSPDVV